MRDDEIFKKIKEYFDIREFVDKTTYDRYKNRCWQFFSPRLLHTLIIIREELGRPITINNWHIGGKFQQRGLRTNVSPLVVKKHHLYLSAHLMGKAVDFDVKGLTAEDVRNWILDNSDLFQCKLRLEHKIAKTGNNISWVHIDCFSNEKNPKIYLFNV